MHSVGPEPQGMSSILDIPSKQDRGSPELSRLLQLRPSHTWEAALRRQLTTCPHSCVGEFGVDRSSVIPGTKAQVTLAHQMALLAHHLNLAAELGRPVSMHMVGGYGHGE